MSIFRRLIFSNIAMVVIPIVAFFIVDILIFVLLDDWFDLSDLQNLARWRFAVLLLVVIVTNGLLTYMVSQSIIKPVNQLILAANKISGGQLDFSIEKTSDDELGRLSETFEEMRVRLKKADELQNQYEASRKELIASISHDLKTPLTSIQGYVKGLQDGIADTPEKKDHYLETINKKTANLNRLIDELFLYSKLDLEREPFQFQAIDLKPYFEDFAEELRHRLPEAAIVFAASPEASYLVKADHEKLQRVMENIIQNALKYMDKANPAIEIRLKEHSDHVEVHIQDNGIGIPEGAIDSVFESFYRADTSRNSNTGGSGLGLAIVKRIIEEHGGQTWAESSAGTGTAIIFTLKKIQRTRWQGAKNIDN